MYSQCWFSIWFLAFVALSSIAPGVRAFYVSITANDENGEYTRYMAPNRTTTLVCYYYTDIPASLEIYVSSATIYTYNFSTGKGKIGADFEDRVQNIRRENRYTYLDLFVPYCHEDGWKACEVFEQTGTSDSHSRPLPTGGIHVPHMYVDGERVQCGSAVAYQDVFNVECKMFDVAPKTRMIWSSSGDHKTDGPTISTKDPETCLYNLTDKAFFTLSPLSLGEIECRVSYYTDDYPCTITVLPRSNVTITPTNEGGEPTDVMTPNQFISLKCTHIIKSPSALTFTNGTGANIFAYNFETDTGKVGAGFETRVKNIKKEGSSISIDLFVPYCHKDGQVQCGVLDQMGTLASDIRTFSIGIIPRLAFYVNGVSHACGSTLPRMDYRGVECVATGIAPEASFTWTNCKQQDQTISEEDRSCLFMQTATANCLFPVGEMGCNVENSVGHEACKVFIDSGDMHNPTED